MGKTQQELANLVGVSRETVGNWETGVSTPRNSMARLREVLDDDLDGTVAPVDQDSGVLLKLAPEAYEGMDPLDRARAEAEATAAWLRVVQEARRRADDNR